MRSATFDSSIDQTPATSGAAMAAPTPTTRYVSKTAVVVGMCFLAATFTFALGNALIRSSFSSATAPGALVAGVLLLGSCGVAVTANGAAMQQVLMLRAPIRARVYLVLRVTECLTLVSVGATRQIES